MNTVAQGDDEGRLIRGLSKAHLPTDDLDRAVAFYESLGLEIAARNERVAFVWTEPGRSRLGLWADEPPANQVGFDVSLGGLACAVEWLAERGVATREVDSTSKPQVHSETATASVSFEDPFGNVLDLVCSLPVEPVAESVGPLSLSEWLDTHRDAVNDPNPEHEPTESVITGLNEAHLPVDDLEKAIEFYDTLGLSVAWRDEDLAFVWVDEGRSWLGLWAGPMPSDHVAFEVSKADFISSDTWLADHGIEIREAFGYTEPFVRLHQANGSTYFDDSEGNGVELLVFLDEKMTDKPEKLTVEEWLADGKEGVEGPRQ